MRACVLMELGASGSKCHLRVDSFPIIASNCLAGMDSQKKVKRKILMLPATLLGTERHARAHKNLREHLGSSFQREHINSTSRIFTVLSGGDKTREPFSTVCSEQFSCHLASCVLAQQLCTRSLQSSSCICTYTQIHSCIIIIMQPCK